MEIFMDQEKSMDYDEYIEEDKLEIIIPKMHIVSEGGILNPKLQRREPVVNDSIQLQSSRRIVPTFSFAREGDLIPSKNISYGGYRYNSATC